METTNTDSGWLIVGIAGGTCSGKSTLARALAERLKERIINNNDNADHCDHSAPIIVDDVRIIRQDDYFYKRDRPEHTWIPGWNYINREILGALDMQRMCADIENVIVGVPTRGTKKNVLIIEGFLIFNHNTIRELCQLHFDVRITYEECQRRRATRRYNPPNPPGYFEAFIWPFYQQHLIEYTAALSDDRHKTSTGGLIVLDGKLDENKLLEETLRHFYRFCQERDII